MNYAELTPGGRSRYHEYMDVPTPERGPGEQEPEFRGDGLIAPAGDAAKSLWDAQKNGTETETAPANAEIDLPHILAKKAQEAKRKPLTRDKLTEYAETLQYTSSPSDVALAAEFVTSAVEVLEQRLSPKPNQSEDAARIYKELQDAHVFDDAQKLLEEVRNGFPGQDKESRAKSALGKAGTVARMAKKVADYFEAAKLTLEADDPFKQVGSFEELMGKFNKTQLEPKFRPGGEFSLIDVEQYEDQYGRTLGKEKAHPENFLRWARERAWFYHDFDQMAPIDLFKGMYIVVGSRQVTMYEMLVDFDIYFSHREPTFGELKVLREDYQHAEDKKEFEYSEEYKKYQREKGPEPDVIGEYIDPKTGKPTGEYVKNIPEYDEQRRQHVYGVFKKVKDKEGIEREVPVEAVLANKEAWNVRQTEGFKEAQGQIMYELWLLTRNHNMDVQYRQKGMPSEVPLKETLTELYADNIWTRTQGRLLNMFYMPTTTHREDRVKIEKDGERSWVKDTSNETTLRMEGKFDKQGSTGKAFQRSLAAYYHISEANAAFNGYKVEGENPFFELLQNKDGVSGAEEFYKSLIRQVLEKDFGYKEEEYSDTKKSNAVAMDVINFLNSADDGRIQRGDGTSRKRFDWEKADLVDLLTLSRKELESKHITREQLDSAEKALREKYKGDQAALDQLNKLLNDPSEQKRQDFVNLLKTKIAIEKEKDVVSAFISQKNKAVRGLDGLAVGVFVGSFGSEYAPDTNPFVNIRYALEARDVVRKAMQDALIRTEKLDAFEAKYAEEWAYAFTFHSGISARNDMGGIGHDAWSKVQNTEFYRLRQSGGGNYPGNLDNLYGIHRLGTDMWQGLKVKRVGTNKYDKTLYEMLTGLDSSGARPTFNINDDMTKFDFAGNSMRQFVADHVGHVIDLFVDITQKHEFNFNNVISEDQLGRTIINHAEMQKMIDSTWKHLRYGFDNNGFLYDNTVYGWWYDETIDDEGQVSRKPHFGFKSIRDLMFSEEVQAMRMYERTDISGWDGRKGNVFETKMARNVFAYLIKAQLQEHVRRDGKAILYSADQVSLLVDAFVGYAARVMRGEQGETVVLSGFFTPEEMARILLFAHAVLWKLYAKEYGEDALGGFLAALLQGMSVIMKEIGAGITLK